MKLSAALLLILPAALPAQRVAIGEYNIPQSVDGPGGITQGPDGALWFTGGDCNNGGGGIGRLTPAGTFQVYAIPTGHSCPYSIVAGPDGALWFTETTSNKIGRITTAGAITEYPLPSDASGPDSITAGPDGALWFTESASIGRITTSGVISLYPLDGNSVASGITAGPDGALWFLEAGSNNIGRITTAGSITIYPVTSGYGLYNITAGPDGALWFPEYESNAIGRITTAGAITQYSIPTANTSPLGIATGPDGALWFTEIASNQIGRITTDGAITEYRVPTSASYPDLITAGPDGALWFSEFFGDRIGEAVIESAYLTVTPGNGYYKSRLSFTGSGFVPNSDVQIYVGGVGSAVLAKAAADSSGNFAVSAEAPESAYGPRIFLGVGGGKLGAADFSMAPRLILSPDSGTAGSAVTATGYGFGSFDIVDVYWNNPRTLLGKVVADIHGTFHGSKSVTFTVPSGAASGPNRIFGNGLTSGAVGSVSFTVE